MLFQKALSKQKESGLSRHGSVARRTQDNEALVREHKEKEKRDEESMTVANKMNPVPLEHSMLRRLEVSNLVYARTSCVVAAWRA